MSYTTLKLTVGPPFPAAKANGSHITASTTVHATTKLNKNQNLQLKDTSTAISRREMLSFAGMSLATFSLSSPDPAEARMTRAEMKNKILGKFRELREKFGSSKSKEEGGEHTSLPEKDIEDGEKQSPPRQENTGVENYSTPTPESKVGEQKSTLQPENKGGEQISTPQPGNESGETSTSQPEGTDKSSKLENEGGGGKSAPQDEDKSPFLPFLNLSENEGEALVEATLSQ